MAFAMIEAGSEQNSSPSEMAETTEHKLLYWAPRPVTHNPEMIRYCKRKGITLNVMENPALPAHLTVKDSPGKGQGVYVLNDMPAGNLIIHENVLVTNKDDFADTAWTDDPDRKKQWNEYLAGHLKWRGKAVVRAFLSLHNAQRPKFGPFASIFDANKIFIDFPAAKFFGVGINLAKVNHSCVPNAQQVWENTKEHGTKIMGDIALYAVKDIKAGEEITIQYAPLYCDAKTRQHYLKTIFGFNCGCQACTTQDPRLEQLFGKMAELVPELLSIEFYAREP